jgi:hypothetical protein
MAPIIIIVTAPAVLTLAALLVFALIGRAVLARRAPTTRHGLRELK